MTPQEFHDACLSALCECPQFEEYEEDTYFEGYGKFGDIPKKGWRKLIKFWKDENLLWDFGYYKCLPDEVISLFERIDRLYEEAIDTATRGEKQP